MDHFRLRPISEKDIDEVIEAVGGRRAHPDADHRLKRGADYLLGDCVIELKALDDEGLTKPERQNKLAALFRPLNPGKPVIVLDRQALPEQEQRSYDRILEGPIKTAVSSAKTQLRQSRSEYPETALSVIWLINNGYTALDNDALLKLVANRVRNDTSEVDGVVVSGCYFYSDSFDSFFLWPIDYAPINLSRTFGAFEKLREAWGALSIKHMNALMRRPPGKHDTKGPVVDTQFEIGGITYVKPTPPIGKASKFFHHGRPRKNSSGLTTCPPVATVFGDLAFAEWMRFHDERPNARWLGDTYEDWKRKRASAAASVSSIRAFVPISVTWGEWSVWVKRLPKGAEFSVHYYATEVFNQRVQALLNDAQEFNSSTVRPCRYVLVMTEEIGQDMANDVSHAIVATEQTNGEPQFEEVFVNQRLFHEHAVALACAHAVARNINIVRWQKDMQYAWI